MEEIIKQKLIKQLKIHVGLAIITNIIVWIILFLHLSSYLFFILTILDIYFIIKLYIIDSKLNKDYQYYWCDQ